MIDWDITECFEWMVSGLEGTANLWEDPFHELWRLQAKVQHRWVHCICRETSQWGQEKGYSLTGSYCKMIVELNPSQSEEENRFLQIGLCLSIYIKCSFFWLCWSFGELFINLHLEIVSSVGIYGSLHCDSRFWVYRVSGRDSVNKWVYNPPVQGVFSIKCHTYDPTCMECPILVRNLCFCNIYGTNVWVWWPARNCFIRVCTCPSQSPEVTSIWSDN